MATPRNVHTLNEGKKRYILIDPALRDAGWNLWIASKIPVMGHCVLPK